MDAPRFVVAWGPVELGLSLGHPCLIHFLAFGAVVFGATAVATETWRGLEVAAEHRCSPYNSRDYAYPQSVEPHIANELGAIHCPYTGECFATLRDTDIEHIIARSEAHDSGLCRADSGTRKAFARDLLNLTLASPSLNRHLKSDRDAAEWMPAENQCWFATRVLEVRRKYGLTIDSHEADALERVLSQCGEQDVVLGPVECKVPVVPPATAVATVAHVNGDVATWDDNGNGRITCAEARRHGIAPVHRSHPAYAYMRDGDGDGVVCK